MKFLSLLALACCLASGAVAPVAAGGQLSLQIHAGSPKSARAVQDLLQLYAISRSIKSGASIHQTGHDNSARIGQQGRGHLGIIRQRGNGHSANLQQTGRGLSYGIFQSGRATSGHVRQFGGFGSGLLFQHGW